MSTKPKMEKNIISRVCSGVCTGLSEAEQGRGVGIVEGNIFGHVVTLDDGREMQ